MAEEEAESSRAFDFDGNWREFAPIAFSNLLLTIVTLGVYNFWARARTRRYLWSRTRFIDDRLEWTGTGLELFLGYLLAFFLFVLPVVGLNFLLQALLIREDHGLAFLVIILVYSLSLYLLGVAIFRGLRYRLSRTYWHGIRGGSNAQGLRYGLSHLWKTAVGMLVFGLMVPWAMVSLWNERWRGMSFGPLQFESEADYGPVFRRYLLYYLLPILLFIAAIVAVAMFGPNLGSTPADVRRSGLIIGFSLYIIFFVVMGLVALFFYAAYFREVVGSLSLGDIDFEFDATTMDWFKLMVVNIALVIFTLGIGSIFLGYRNWSFFARHLNAYGQLNLDSFTQSETRTPGQGEGLLDVLDVGAF